MKTSNKTCGFTLIEVLLVTIILVVIVGLAVPSFSSTYHKFQLKKSVNHLTYLMRYAQSRAVTKQMIVRLTFSEDFKEYWLEQANEETEEFESVGGRFGKHHPVSDDVIVEFDQEFAGEDIEFFSDGQIDKMRLFLCYEEICMTVSTKEQRGYVRIYEGKI